MASHPVVLAAALACIGLAAGCSGSASPRLKLAGYNGGTAGAAIPDVKADTPFFFSTYDLCADRGKVSPTSVSLTHATGGLKVVDWGVNAVESGIGADPGRVLDLPGYTHGPITAGCGGAGVRLDVSVQSSADVASADSFVVHYKSGQVVVPFAVMICTATCPKTVTARQLSAMARSASNGPPRRGRSRQPYYCSVSIRLTSRVLGMIE